MDLSQPEKNIAGTEDTLESSFIQLVLTHRASTGIVFIFVIKIPPFIEAIMLVIWVDVLVFPTAGTQISAMLLHSRSSQEGPKSIFSHKREYWGQMYSHRFPGTLDSLYILSGPLSCTLYYGQTFHGEFEGPHITPFVPPIFSTQ